MALRLRRGTDTERQLITPLEGELIYTTDNKELWVGDGSTQGGLRVTGSIPTSINDLNDVFIETTPTVGQILKWDGANFVLDSIPTSINDLNDVFIETTPTVGQILKWDGANFVPSDDANTGIVEGATYQINIASDDSTVILDANTQSANLNSIVVNTDFQFGNDTSLLKKRILNTSFNQRAIEINDILINSSSLGMTTLMRGSRGTLEVPSLINNNDILYSLSMLGWDGVKHTLSSVLSFTVDNTTSENVIPGRIALITANSLGVLDSTSGVHLTSDQRVGIMTSSPEETLDVNGNLKVRNNAVVSGFIQFGSYTDLEIANITPVNGMVYYNSTVNRFRGYQNGSWINLDDGSAA